MAVGCDLGDSGLLSILNKAAGCLPPIAITIVAENLDEKPILRVSIPASKNRPHCTSRGVYCRRDGNRNRPLHPSELLEIFLTAEGRAFAAKFEEGATQITDSIAELEESLGSVIDNMASQLGWADMQLGDTEGLLRRLISDVDWVQQRTNDANKRLRQLFIKDAIEDPVINRAKSELEIQLLNEIRKKVAEDPGWLKKWVGVKGEVELNLSGRAGLELDKDDVQATLHEVLRVAFKSGK